MKMRFWSVLVLLQFLGISARAATYYVATNGNNANAGSAAAPFRTIQQAANIVAPGDVVMVQPGDYGELVNIARDASPSQRITFIGNNARLGGFNVRKSDYTFRSFDLNGTNASMAAPSALLYVYPNAHRVHLLDSYLHDATNKFAVWLSQTSDGVLSNASSFCVISNNTVVDIDYVNICSGGISNKFLKNIFRDANGQADIFRLWGRGHIAADNLITNISMIIENHTDFFQAFGPESVRGPNDYTLVQDIVLERNIIINSRLQVCQLETFINPPGNMTNLIFRNNLFINLPYAANVDMDGTKWHNNVFYKVNYGNGGHVFALGGNKGSAYGTEILNNMFIECGNGQDWVGWYPIVGQFGITNFDLKANGNYVCGPNFVAKKTVATLSTGWGAQGQEAQGINGGNPSLASVSALDFRPILGSRMINGGVAVSTIKDDILGKIRADGRPDIGAFEFFSLNAIAPPSNLRVVNTY